MNFTEIFLQFDWDQVKERIYSKNSSDVELALANNKRTLDDFCSLISTAALPYLEQMAKLSRERTLKRFGKTIQLYSPIYVSNVCQNSCLYCGFNAANSIKRITLNEDELLQELKAVKLLGFDHVLLVSGEAPNVVTLDYLKQCINIAKKMFSHISLEIQPLDESDYAQLVQTGLNTVYIYQETYHQNDYKIFHPRGKKADFNYRLETPDRLGRAGIYKVGLGVLLGLNDWRVDSFFTALHMSHLEKQYWKTKYSISFPRLRPATGIIEPSFPVSDKELVQLICAYRLFNEEVELSISTRESAKFRDNIIHIGATSLSAGSKTNPGGYTQGDESLSQFDVADERTPAEIAAMIKKQGYEVVWKDWDSSLQ